MARYLCLMFPNQEGGGGTGARLFILPIWTLCDVKDSKLKIVRVFIISIIFIGVSNYYEKRREYDNIIFGEITEYCIILLCLPSF